MVGDEIRKNKQEQIREDLKSHCKELNIILNTMKSHWRNLIKGVNVM